MLVEIDLHFNKEMLSADSEDVGIFTEMGPSLMVCLDSGSGIGFGSPDVKPCLIIVLCYMALRRALSCNK